MMPSLVLGTFIYTLDSTIAAVALPHMQGTFSANQEQVAWVLTSYIVMSAIMTPMAGYLADRLGRRRLYLVSIAGFIATSMLCGLSVNLEEMVVFRVLQGAFGAAMIPLAQATVLDVYPPDQYGPAMAMFGVGVMFGPIIGPTLGAWLIELYDWRWVFFINLPVGIIAYLGARATVPASRHEDRARPFDVAGFAYLSIAIGSFQLMMDRGNGLSWFQSTEIIVEATVSALCMYLFIVHIFTHARPFVTAAMFRDRNFTSASIIGFAVGFNMMATMALLPPMLQHVLGYPVLLIGWVLAPRGIGTMLSMLLVGRLVNHVDARLLILIGLLISAASLSVMTTFDRYVSVDLLVYSGLLQGIGIGFMFVPLSSVAFVTLAPRYRNEAAGIYSLARNIGSSIGISVLMGSLAVFHRASREQLVEHVSPFTDILRYDEYAYLTELGGERGYAVLDLLVQQEALMLAYIGDFRTMTLITLACIPLLALLKSNAARPAPA
jgi:DHA2 family multidrug resistance protein